jgi:hypothetical protein
MYWSKTAVYLVDISWTCNQISLPSPLKISEDEISEECHLVLRNRNKSGNSRSKISHCCPHTTTSCATFLLVPYFGHVRCKYPKLESPTTTQQKLELSLQEQKLSKTLFLIVLKTVTTLTVNVSLVRKLCLRVCKYGDLGMCLRQYSVLFGVLTYSRLSG